MTTTYTDRLQGLLESVAVKPPCVAVTSGQTTLSGLQTIGGVVLAAGDRVLVRAQVSPVENGIYNASTSAWTRALDFDGNRDAVQGTLVLVHSATADAAIYELTTANPVLIGSSLIAFALRLHNLSIVYAQTQAEIDAAKLPVNYGYPECTVDRYGTNVTPGTTDMSTAANAARAVAEQASTNKGTGAIVSWLGNTYYMGSAYRSGNWVRNIGVGPLPTLIYFNDALTGNNAELKNADGTYAFGATFEKIKIRQGNSAKRAVYSPGAHQHSGLKGVTISNIGEVGFEFGSAGGPARLDLDVWLEASANAYHGATTLTASKVTGNTIMPVAVTTSYAIGDYASVLLDTGRYHHAKVASVSAGVSITLDVGLPSNAASGNGVHLTRMGGIIKNGSVNHVPLLDVEGNGSYPIDICMLQEHGHLLIGEFHTEYARDGVVCANTDPDDPEYVRIGTATGSDTVETVVRVRAGFIGGVSIGFSTGGDQAGNSNLINEITTEDFGANPVVNYEFATPAAINAKPASTAKFMAMRTASVSNWGNRAHVIDASTTVAARIYASILMRDVNGGAPLNAAGLGFAFDAGGYYDMLLGAANGAGVLDAKVRIRGNNLIEILNGLGNFANDGAAAAGSVPIDGLYRNGSIVMIRVA